MRKWLIKKLCPSVKTLAGYAADGIADAVNGRDADVKAKVARYAFYAATVTQVANTLAKMAEDGAVDDAEKKELAAMMEPGIAAALKYAFDW